MDPRLKAIAEHLTTKAHYTSTSEAEFAVRTKFWESLMSCPYIDNDTLNDSITRVELYYGSCFGYKAK